MAAHPFTIDETIQQHPFRAGRAGRMLAVSVTLGLAIATSPIPHLLDSPFIDDGAAWARGNGGGGNGGGGNGGGNGGGGNGGGVGDDRGAASDASSGRGGGWGRGGGDLVSVAGDEDRGRGRSRGGDDVGHGKSQARERYAASLERDSRGSDRDEVHFGRREAELDRTLSAALAANGWQGRASLESTGFRNHGERVSTMVELSKTLGYGAHVGALQANFGGLYAPPATKDDSAARETLSAELAGLQEELGKLEDQESEAARALAEQIDTIEAELTALDAVDETAPEWDGDWRTANLDVNGDGVIDRSDLEAARAVLDQPTPEEASEETITDDTVVGTPVDKDLTSEESASDDGETTEPPIEQATTEIGA